MKRLLALLSLAVASFLLLGGTAQAQKVANPGTFNFKIINGVLKVKDQEFGFDESQNINFNGTVDKAGNISIPSMTFPDFPLSASGFNLTIKINVVGPTTGTINPATGVAALRLKVWIKIDGVPLGGGCAIASAGSPIDLNMLVTGASGSLTGTGYDVSNATMKLVNATYSVPASSSCGLASGTVDSTVGLPSASGQNQATFVIKSTPTANRAVNPALTVNPTSGTAPLPVNFSAAGTTVSAPPASYRWDFDGDGTFDQTTSTPSTSHTYTSGGAKNAVLRVVDNEGDFGEITKTVNVTAYPDLRIQASHDADFRVGSVGTWKVNVNNHGYAPTSGPVTVSTTLPAGMSYVSSTGSGWSCNATGQDVSCSRSTAIPVGGQAPELGLNVRPGSAAFGNVTGVFNVAATGDNGPGDNQASDEVRVRATDLAVDVSHSVHAMLPGTDPANKFKIDVRNVGDAPSAGSIVVKDTLPAGLTPLSASGPGWSCSVTGQAVECSRSDALTAGDSLPGIDVQVEAFLDPGVLGVTVPNKATVEVSDDLDSANNEDTDPTLILNGQDIGVTKSHQGNFTAGKQESYTIAVHNYGTASTTGPTTVTDQLPGTLDFVSVSGGPDWDCSEQDGTVTCTYAAPIAAGESAPDIALAVDVSIGAIPAVTNTATVATPDDPNPANDSSSDPAVVQAIDMKVTKSHTATLRVGHQATYTLEAGNIGDSPTVGPVTVTDVLPTGLSLAGVDAGPDWNCDTTGGQIACQHDDEVASGQSLGPIDVKVDVLAAAAPSVSNTATVSTQSDFNPANNSSTDTDDVIDIDASVEIGRTGAFKPGHQGTYLVTAANIGVVPTSGPVTVEVDLPSGLVFDSAIGTGWTCLEDAGTVSCEHSGIAAESTAPVIQIKVDVTPAAAGTVTATATIATAGDRYPANDEDTDTTNVFAPNLSVASSHSGSFWVGQMNSYRIDVGNHGNGPTTGPVTVVDTLPTGFGFVRAVGSDWDCDHSAGTVTCLRANPLAAGVDSDPITIDVKINPAALAADAVSGTADNRVSVTTDSDADPADDSATDSTDLVATDVSVNLNGPSTVASGGVASFELGVSAANAAPTSGPVRATIDLPAGFSPRGGSGQGWSCASAGTRFNCLYTDQLAAGADAPTLTLQARAGEGAAGTAPVKAKVSTKDDVISGNDLAEGEIEVTSGADLGVELTARTTDGDSFRSGTDGSYRVVVRNVGSASTGGTANVALNLPTGLNLLGLESGQGWTCTKATSGADCTHPGTLDPGDASAFVIRVGVRDAASAVEARADVSVPGDLNPENDRSVAINQVSVIDLALSRTQSNGWRVGGLGLYDVVVKNVGSAATDGPTVVVERLPRGTTYQSVSGPEWSCAVSGRVLRCVNSDPIAPGQSSSFVPTLSIGAAAMPGVTVTSEVSTAGDADASNNSASEEISVEGATIPRLYPAKVASGKASVTESGIVTLWLSCPAEAGFKCAGQVRLTRLGSAKVLGKSGFSLAPGRKVPVRVQLKAAGRKAIRKARRTKLRALVVNKGVAGTNRTVVVRRAGR